VNRRCTAERSNEKLITFRIATRSPAAERSSARPVNDAWKTLWTACRQLDRHDVEKARKWL
jgi:hypothetical protein